MFKLFEKKTLATLLVLVSLSTINSISAQDCCTSDCNRFYIGGFGGEAYSGGSTRLIQQGTVFFSEAVGGPLAVNARGNSHKRTSSGFGGGQIGFELRQCGFGFSNLSLTPGAEIEAYFFRHNKKAHLINPTVRLTEHDFLNTFPMRVGVYFFNGVLSLNSCCFPLITPYIAGGVGAARISIRNAKSLQVEPPEAGVNHFDSDRSDTSWAFAAQAKAGLRFNILERVHIFGEYRYLYIDSSNYIFGSTVAEGHAPTSPWNVEVKSLHYNAFAVGLQFDLY